MISHPDRQHACRLIDQAQRNGAAQSKACDIVGISMRTYQRWRRDGVRADRRPTAVRPTPKNKLTEEERQRILAVCNSAEYASAPPGQIVPCLADRSLYIGSESTFYRVLREAGLQHQRGRARPRCEPRPPPSHRATRPNAVWSWDVSWLPGPVTGVFYYLYLILDIYSRKIVGWEVHLSESGANAAALVRQAVLREGCISTPLVLHADNGSPQKASALKVTLENLGIEPSYSRPRVSNDNAFAEAVFRTTKYRPDYPYRGFATLEEARRWMYDFVLWYNHSHRHRGIRYVTPAARHAGEDVCILAKRKAVYEAAKARHPQRWSGPTRNWTPVGEVWLNPANDDDFIDANRVA
jgi:transposase InsO family protein